MKNRKEIIKKLESKFALKMEMYGFNKKFINSNLRRKNNYGKDIIHFIYKDYGDLIRILVEVGIRYDSIMNYIYKLLKKYNYISNYKDSTMIGHYLYVIGNDSKKEYIINSEKDIDRVIDEIYNDVTKYALPFFEKYSDINEVFQYSLDDNRPLRLMPMDVYRVIESIVISKLYNLGDTNKLIKNRSKYINLLDVGDDNQKNFIMEIFNAFLKEYENDLDNEKDEK